MANLVCSKCGKTKKETDFYKMKTGERCDMCKTCLTMHIDNRDPQTFLWILEKFDVPYIEDVWIQQANKVYLKNPGKFGPMSVIGTYMRTMNMAQYSEYSYADSEKLNNARKYELEEAQKRRTMIGKDDSYEIELKQKLENGEISEAEYNTLTMTNVEDTAEILEIDTPTPQFIADVNINEEDIKNQLTEEDIQYLALKWGLLYKPSEWVKMEETYNQYATEYEMSVDREQALKSICKISLKMDKALDIDDVKTYKDLSVVYDQMRKSAKFTEAQNKEEQTRDIDSIGELVAFVEQQGGAIPCYEDTIEYPQDKVDFTIKDIKTYVDRLVKEELGLSDLIESFIEKAEQTKENSVESIMENAFKEKPKEEIEDEELLDQQSWSAFLDHELLEQSNALIEQFAGDDI